MKSVESINNMNIKVPRKYHFDTHIIEGVTLHPILSFAPVFEGGQITRTSEEQWLYHLINDVIPKLGEKYMYLFIRCNFNPAEFLRLVVDS